MKNLIKNLKPHVGLVLLMIVFLCVQAYCDMSIPTYTQNLIDTGIQNKGIEHILPEKTTPEEYSAAQIFMTDSEKKIWQDSYKKDGKNYKRKNLSEDALSDRDDELMTPIVMTYQLGHMNTKAVRRIVGQMLSQNPQTQAMAANVNKMSISEIEQMTGLKFKTFRAKDENENVRTFVDMRPVMQQMLASGRMDQSMIDKSKKETNKMLDKAGDSTMKAMGISYAASCDEKAGMNVDKIQTSYLWKCGGEMVVMAAIMMLSAVVAAYIGSRIGASVGRELRSKLFRNVMSFSNAEMNKFQTSSLITRATNDIQQIQQVSSVALRFVLYSPILAAWGIYKVYQTGANMSWVIILGIVTAMVVMGALLGASMPKFRIMQKLVDALNGVSREMLTGVSVIRAFGREKTEEERFDKANTDLMKTQLFTNRIMTFMRPSMVIVMNALVVLITWVAAHKINDGTLQVGAMTAFITYAMIIVTSFLIIAAMAIFLPRAGIAADRVHEVISTETSIKEKKDAKDPEGGRGEISFNHVSFRYPDAEQDVLHDISFTAKPGETTAIIGSTGSGKSSIVSLIPRFYDVTGGSITLDGQDIRDLRIKGLRDLIGYVPQKGVLFSGTIASNIRFGDEEATDDEVKRAAEIAQADDFIEEKEDKYDSFIAQGGSNVSGGQKQRLAIARAIAKKPKVLVFDDSFSALDMKTDAKLRSVLAKEEKDAAKIIVAQRVGTILDAEQILVIDDGRIVGKGTHDELMKNCSVYREIAESQLSSQELEGIE